MDEETLQKLGKDIEDVEEDKEEEEEEDEEEERDRVDAFEDIKSQLTGLEYKDGTQSRQGDDLTSMRSVSTSKTMINKLEKELGAEKKAREKLQEEIEELKRMNNQLCSAIMSNK